MALIQLPSMDDAVAALIVSTHACVEKVVKCLSHTCTHTESVIINPTLVC